MGLKVNGLDSLVGETLLTGSAFKTYYNNAVKGLSCSKVIGYNNAIMKGEAPTTGTELTEKTELEAFYRAAGTNLKKAANEVMQQGIEACSAMATASTSSGKTANPTPSSLIHSYSQFGSLYSKETQGKTWPEIMRIDKLVRESTTALGGSLAVKSLNYWYRHQATAAEKKDFDDNAVKHMKLGAAMWIGWDGRRMTPEPPLDPEKAGGWLSFFVDVFKQDTACR